MRREGDGRPLSCHRDDVGDGQMLADLDHFRLS
jgi:hypothetical protein